MSINKIFKTSSVVVISAFLCFSQIRADDADDNETSDLISAQTCKMFLKLAQVAADKDNLNGMLCGTVKSNIDEKILEELDDVDESCNLMADEISDVLSPLVNSSLASIEDGDSNDIIFNECFGSLSDGDTWESLGEILEKKMDTLLQKVEGQVGEVDGEEEESDLISKGSCISYLKIIQAATTREVLTNLICDELINKTEGEVRKGLEDVNESCDPLITDAQNLISPVIESALANIKANESETITEDECFGQLGDPVFLMSMASQIFFR